MFVFVEIDACKSSSSLAGDMRVIKALAQGRFAPGQLVGATLSAPEG